MEGKGGYSLIVVEEAMVAVRESYRHSPVAAMVAGKVWGEQ